jgi:iron complex outermembrane receptor protein
MGAFSAMSLRGAPPGHVTVLLDGVPLTSAARGVVDLGSLPATAIESIEVYRGSTPASLASPTPGGAVNLVTHASPGTREVRLASGSFRTGEAQASLGAQRGAWSVLAHGGWQGSDGDFAYEDDNGTPLEPSDDGISTRQNARFDASTALLRGGYAPGDRLQASARVEYFRRAQGVPGTGANPSLHAHFDSERWVGAGHVRTVASSGMPSAEWRGYGTWQRDRLQDRQSELGLGALDTDERFGDLGTQLELVSPSSWDAISLRAGGALRAEGAEPAAPTANLPDPPKSTRDSRSAWLGAQWGTPESRLLVTGGHRWDHQHEELHETRSTGALRTRVAERTLAAPQAGARARLGLGLELRGNWSRGSRAPDFDELFGIDGFVTGNPTLVPEHSESWDAGFAWTRAWSEARFTLEWSHHATHAEQLIVYERNTPRGARPSNVGAARLFGEETGLRAGWRGWELSASTSWLSATDRSGIVFYQGKRLPQRAERQWYGRLKWQRRGWLASGDVEYLGDIYLDRANLQHEPERTLYGASLGKRLGRATLLAEGRNLSNVLARDVAGFPLPGRMLVLALTLDFGGGGPPP